MEAILMNVTIFGAGNMARGIALRLLAGGNTVTLIDREADKAATLAQELSAFTAKGASVKSASLSSPIADPVVVNAVWYPATLDVVQSYGAQLAGKILVDISNPLNQTFDDLATPPGSSAAEELARVAPAGAKVVKAFNTTFAGLLAQGHVAGQPLDVFIAGDDERAKATVARLIEAGGQRVLDAGPLKRARQLEGLALLSIVLQSKLDKPWMSAVKIVS
jgi:8-hydroxy-5-deazaflavin:NADPH oxidoreductase